jgi:Bacteriophage lambda head decoration protein D
MAVVKKLVECQHTWEFVVSEEEEYASRDTITIDINQTIVPGTVLAHKGAAVGVITTPGVGTWAAWVSGDANYGVACGVAGYGITTGAATAKTVGLVRGNAQVRRSDLQWAGTPTAPQQATALSQLESRMISAR